VLPLLSIRDLTVSFGSAAAARNVSFDIAPGETLALVGESGSGKSVTALSALRLLPASAHLDGDILFEGENLARADAATLRAVRGNRVGMIFQEPMSSLNPVHTIGRQIGEVLAIHQGLRQTAARARDAVARARAVLALRETDRRKDEFLAMLAHELRNPLAPISSAAELLRLGQLDEARVCKASNIISRQVRHMTGLIDDLLDVSRVTRGLVALDPHAIDARTVVSEAIEQVRPLIEQRRHRLAVHLAPEPAYVWGDLKRLVQCVANILNNAAKYTPEGGNIALHLVVQGRQMAMTVADDGIGIDTDVRARLFEAFATTKEDGMGLGLSICRTIVEAHGGRIWADGVPSGGTAFHFTVPLAPLQEGDTDV